MPSLGVKDARGCGLVRRPPFAKKTPVQVKAAVSTLVKLGVSVGLIGFLGYRASHDPQFGELLAGPKNWALLAAALPLCLVAVTVTILRWHMLLTAQGLSFSLRE